jgi:hypothetical protein
MSGGRDVHHGSSSMSRKRRHGASCRLPSIGSRAASDVESSFVCASVAIGVSAFATSVDRSNVVSRFVARRRCTGSSPELAGCRPPGKPGTGIGRGTRFRIRK